MPKNCLCSITEGACAEHTAYFAERNRLFGSVADTVSEADEVELARRANAPDSEFVDGRTLLAALDETNEANAKAAATGAAAAANAANADLPAEPL